MASGSWATMKCPGMRRMGARIPSRSCTPILASPACRSAHRRCNPSSTPSARLRMRSRWSLATGFALRSATSSEHFPSYAAMILAALAGSGHCRRQEESIYLRRLFAVVLLLAIAFGAGIAQAQVDPSLFQDLRWRLIGPFRGGRVLTAAGVPSEPERFYFGSVNGGVWETRDAGRTWQPNFDGQPVGSIGALAVAPSDPRVIYVGSGEADMRSDIAQGNGMYRSADGGKTWTRIGLADSQQIGRVLIDPRNPDV